MNIPIVETRSGKLQGTQEGSLHVFRGIPFAQPPVGSLRFRAPAPPKAWSGVRDVNEFSPSPLQANAFGLTALSEDCLYLNIWTPGIDHGQRPVLVWIYGGAFTSGSATLYSGDAFAQHGDIVVVTLNYRLGALGFLYLGELLGPEYASSGNCGLLDIVAALRWVHENIAAFGGDPAQVTIMGESAGAKCVGTLQATPSAQGLFHRAIQESGAGHCTRDCTTATSIAQHLLAELGLKSHEAQKLLDLPAETIVAAQSRVAANLQSFGPVVDNEVLPYYPLEAIRQGTAGRVPTLIGSNRDEGKLYVALDPRLKQPNEYALQAYFGNLGPAVYAAYQAASEHSKVEDAWPQTLTDYLYRLAAVCQAERQAEHNVPVWMYRFDWAGPLGAYHGMELPFVFHGPLKLFSPALEDMLKVALTPENTPLADLMHAAWIAFIRTGNPQIAGLPDWPRYTRDTPNERLTMIFDTPCHVEQIPPTPIQPDFSIQQAFVLQE